MTLIGFPGPCHICGRSDDMLATAPTTNPPETSSELVDDELVRLEREIATEWARTCITQKRLAVGDFAGWADLRVFGKASDRYARYLELRGLLERHPENPNLVRVRD